MSFRKPISTLDGLTWWGNVRQNEYFILQKHKVGKPMWPYKYRIIMRENSMEIANANDYEEIEFDWKYSEKHAVPQLEEKIDWLNKVDFLDVVTKVIMGLKK